jgi:hypothetical protein
MASQLDHLIAQSKQITEDLMTVRRQAKIPASSRSEREARRRVEDRLYLVLESLHGLTDEVREAWMQAARISTPKQERAEAVRTALDNGQLKLISGDRS